MEDELTNPSYEHIPDVVQETPVVKKRGSKKFLIFIVFFLVIAAGAIYFFINWPGNTEQTEVEPISQEVEVITNDSIFSDVILNSEDTVEFQNPEVEYTFLYLRDWKIDTEGSLTVLADSNNQNFETCETSIPELLSCDIAISTTPYAGVGDPVSGVTATSTPEFGDKNTQAKEIASLLSVGSKVTAIKVGSFSGYEVTDTSAEGSTYNIVLQGDKNMILIQFPFKSSISELSNELVELINSIKER